jgi:pimeloyl-ACP methyl ester carboxylesterase
VTTSSTADCFFVGGRYCSVGGRDMMRGQAYVRSHLPTTVSHAYPLILLPGGGLTGACFEATPDGRPGWASYFRQFGYAVYCVDQVARGRSAYQGDTDGPLRTTDVAEVQRNFTAPAVANSYPQAHLHTQWPGSGTPGDPVFDQFYASMVPWVSDAVAADGMRHAIGELLRLLGPSILVTHSQSGMFAWPIADDQPHLVAGCILLEGAQNVVTMFRIGPPDWFGYGEVKAPWGITNVPITFDPPVSDPSELSFVQQAEPDAPDLIRCYLQVEPARQLPRLNGIPILSVAAQASFGSSREHSLQKFLAQAGVDSDFVRLEDAGIVGNGHLMMLEKNHLDVAAMLRDWIVAKVETGANQRRLATTTSVVSGAVGPAGGARSTLPNSVPQ